MITYIDKDIVSDKGFTLKYHFISQIRCTQPLEGDIQFVAIINSYNTLPSLINGGQPNEVLIYKLSSLDSVNNFDAIYTTIVEDASNKLYQGVVTVTQIETANLNSLKEQKWTQVKRWRSADINTNLTTPYGVFQASPEDRSNITDAILLAQTLTSMSQPVAIPWTLADNSVITMDLTMLTNVGLLLGQKVQTAHARARTLRTAIDDPNATLESISALTWEVPV